MALCTSCGSEVAGSASFCTSCGQRLPGAAQPATAVTVTRLLCSACGAQADPGSLFCTGCGQRLEAAPASITAQASAAPSEPNPSVTPAVQTQEATRPVSEQPAAAQATEPAVASPAFMRVETTPSEVAVPPAMEPAPQIAAPPYAAPSEYRPEQPRTGAFRLIVFILLLIIVAGAFGGWYFWGVETVIVCSPPDVQVFLDDQELAPTSYGRYVIPHLPRKAHVLKVQRSGYADTIEKLDFPLSSSREWVNIRLVRSRPTRSVR